MTIAGVVEVEPIPASDAHPTLFVPGGYSDDDSGGWVFEETRKNLQLCIDEKTRKVDQVRRRFPV